MGGPRPGKDAALTTPGRWRPAWRLQYRGSGPAGL